MIQSDEDEIKEHECLNEAEQALKIEQQLRQQQQPTDQPIRQQQQQQSQHQRTSYPGLRKPVPTPPELIREPASDDLSSTAFNDRDHGNETYHAALEAAFDDPTHPLHHEAVERLAHQLREKGVPAD